MHVRPESLLQLACSLRWQFQQFRPLDHSPARITTRRLQRRRGRSRPPTAATSPGREGGYQSMYHRLRRRTSRQVQSESDSGRQHTSGLKTCKDDRTLSKQSWLLYRRRSSSLILPLPSGNVWHPGLLSGEFRHTSAKVIEATLNATVLVDETGRSAFIPAEHPPPISLLRLVIKTRVRSNATPSLFSITVDRRGPGWRRRWRAGRGGSLGQGAPGDAEWTDCSERSFP